METYIAFLRGINVSGQKLIKMTDLKQMFEQLNFKDVHTYIQSGNVVFKSEETNNRILSHLISDQILKKFNFEVPVTVIKMEDLIQIIHQNPFANYATNDESYFYVTFLSATPKAIDIHLFEKKMLDGEAIQMGLSCIYLYLPQGAGKTKLTNTFLEKQLNVSATTRNFKTCRALIQLAQSIQVKTN